MPTDTTPRVFPTAAKLSVLAGAAMALSGCLVAVPPALQVASLALDGFSYVTTGKSVTDHAISTVTAKDCAMLRGLRGDEICTEEATPQLALRPDGTPPAQHDAPQNEADTPDAAPTLDEILAAAEADDPDMSLDISTAGGPTE